MNKLRYVSVPTIIVERPSRRSDWIWHGHNIEEATVDRVSETRAKIDYILKSDYETMREIHGFEEDNISMS